EPFHNALKSLEVVGIGSEVGSVNVIPLEISRTCVQRQRARKKLEEVEEKATMADANATMVSGPILAPGALMPSVGASSSSLAEVTESARRKRASDKFRAIASQIRVEQVTEEIRIGSSLTFDYIMFLIISCTIAAIGLGTNNMVVVVAAMLVSPIMGPVLAFTFGTNVRDWDLTKQGFLVEVCG
ncbi:unnamed protein product, partial [Choristocarpus tenellus]